VEVWRGADPVKRRRTVTSPDGKSESDVDPEAFLAALLHTSKEDAAEVREQADEKADPRDSE
jgi:hypothetical protein